MSRLMRVSSPNESDFPVQGNPDTGAIFVELPEGGTSGTQYTEDAAAAANPVGTAVNLIRQDTPTALTTADGDNVAQRGTDYGAGYVQIVTSAGAFVDSFGGGSQYTEGDTDATITGTAIMLEGAANTLVAAPGTAADGMLVNLGANNDVTVTSLPEADSTNIDNIESHASRLLSSAGPKAAGAAVATTAFQVGGTYNATPPTVADTQEVGLQVDASGNIKTNVAVALPAGTNLIGKTGIDQTTNGTTNAVYSLETSDVLSLTLTLDTSAYASGDVLAATQELAGVARINAGTARLESLMVIDKDDQKQGMTIVFLKTNVALGTENAAPSISDADAVEYLGHVKIAAADYIDMGGVAVAMPVDTPLAPFMLKAGAASTSVFVAVISDGTGTYTGSGVVLNIGIVRM